MNKKIGSLALGLALLSLTGCGLKGPLYFPPADNKSPHKASKQQQAAQPQEMEQSMTPDRNDRGVSDDPMQVIY